MTPQQKAAQLIDDFYQIYKELLDVNDAHGLAKMAATKVCNEMIIATPSSEYWRDVKVEINK